MSQEGAKTLAKQGWTAEQILKHYYNDSKISIATDSVLARPAKVTHAGVSIELKEYLARVAYREIGSPAQVGDEALKAQMICAYTFAKKKSFKTTDVDQVILPTADWNGNYAKQFHTKMLKLAGDVLGKYVSYNGGVADTYYFASCGGYTASGKYAWSGADPAPYLTGGRTSPETVDRTNPSFTTDEIRALVTAYNQGKAADKKITLGNDASQWIRVLSTDAYGYVEKIMIGNREFTGGNARYYFFGARALRSHNFTMSFVAG